MGGAVSQLKSSAVVGLDTHAKPSEADMTPVITMVSPSIDESHLFSDEPIQEILPRDDDTDLGSIVSKNTKLGQSSVVGESNMFSSNISCQTTDFMPPTVRQALMRVRLLEMNPVAREVFIAYTLAGSWLHDLSEDLFDAEESPKFHAHRGSVETDAFSIIPSLFSYSRDDSTADQLQVPSQMTTYLEEFSLFADTRKAIEGMSNLMQRGLMQEESVLETPDPLKGLPSSTISRLLLAIAMQCFLRSALCVTMIENQWTRDANGLKLESYIPYNAAQLHNRSKWFRGAKDSLVNGVFQRRHQLLDHLFHHASTELTEASVTKLLHDNEWLYELHESLNTMPYHVSLCKMEAILVGSPKSPRGTSNLKSTCLYMNDRSRTLLGSDIPSKEPPLGEKLMQLHDKEATNFSLGDMLCRCEDNFFSLTTVKVGFPNTRPPQKTQLPINWQHFAAMTPVRTSVVHTEKTQQPPKRSQARHVVMVHHDVTALLFPNAPKKFSNPDSKTNPSVSPTLSFDELECPELRSTPSTKSKSMALDCSATQFALTSSSSVDAYRRLVTLRSRLETAENMSFLLAQALG